MSLVDQILDEIDAERLERQEKYDLITQRNNNKIYKEQKFWHNYW